MKNSSVEDIAALKQFFQTPDYAHGAIIDLEHKTTDELFNAIRIPTLIIHSEEDSSVAFDHGLYSKEHIKTSELYTVLLLDTSCSWQEVALLHQQSSLYIPILDAVAVALHRFGFGLAAAPVIGLLSGPPHMGIPAS